MSPSRSTGADATAAIVRVSLQLAVCFLKDPKSEALFFFQKQLGTHL
jgi:hypothetical protein